jgi:hypothetical protein
VYRDTPSIKDDNFSNDFISTCDKLSTTYDNFLVIGDLNYDMLSPQKFTPLKNVCDIFDFTNMIKSPTCFTKNAPPTLNDVILTNQSNYCQNALISTVV